jgi:hypothetical protein
MQLLRLLLLISNNIPEQVNIFKKLGSQIHSFSESKKWIKDTTEQQSRDTYHQPRILSQY